MDEQKFTMGMIAKKFIGYIAYASFIYTVMILVFKGIDGFKSMNMIIAQILLVSVLFYASARTLLDFFIIPKFRNKQ